MVMPKKKSIKKKTSKTRQKKGVSKSDTKKKKAPIKKTEKKTNRRLKYPKAAKCCPHCPDHQYCKDKGVCCNYCDFYFKGHCMYEKEKDLITPNGNVIMEMSNYRGDDYGIDDYEAYESVYD
jgi:hypothetical protein